MALIPGVRLGPYEILLPLGAGGMGEVFLATDTRLDRRVALKVLPSAFALDDDRRRRFMREARAASGLSHPNVATIYDIGETSGVSYIAMEYIDGRTLADRIKGTTIAPNDIAELGGQIADALYAAHERGVVHRDIKPANVMITSRGQAKVLDFGLARIDEPTLPPTAVDVTPEAATTPGIVMGTVAYMSPEQAIGAPLDHRTDLFSLGVVLYQMATGRLPFSGSTELHTIELIRHAQPEAVTRYNVDVPSELERIIRKCLEKRREQRYQSAQELMIDLQALSRGSDAGHEHLPEKPRHNLPAELTSFVGRRNELADLPRVLASSRLLSLTGAGGAGKTRLAVRLASDLVKEFAEGVWLVDLAPLSAPDLVPQTIATVLGIREGPQRPVWEALQEHLRQRHLLLVLDNCEHLIDACAELVEALLRGAPALRILTTSREALGVPGEIVCRVPSLSLPEGLTSLSVDALLDAEATRLFIERATAVEPGFTVTPENAVSIADICRRVDGIPLAIELAAARVAVLSVEQINTRLQDRFRLLTGGMGTAVALQRTLEATVDWSYQLLSDVERQLLSRLSVFPGGWTLEAAEKICGGDGIQASDMLDLLSKLVSKSLRGLSGWNTATTSRLPRVPWRREKPLMPAAKPTCTAGHYSSLPTLPWRRVNTIGRSSCTTNRSTCVGAPVKCGAWALCYRQRPPFASFAEIWMKRGRRHSRRCRAVRHSRMHGGSRGVSKSSRPCWPPEGTPTKRPGCGVPQTDCWKPWAARWWRPTNGYGIATSSP